MQRRRADENNIFATAELAARAGQHQTAIELLLCRRRLALPREHTSVSLKYIAEEILERGCMEPWPATLVELARGTEGLNDKVLPIEDFMELVGDALKKQEDEGKNPFSKGAPVRVLVRETWMNARIHGKKEKPDRKSFDDETVMSRECRAFIKQRRKEAEEAKLKEAKAKAKAEQLVAAEQVASPNELLEARKALEAATKAADEASKKATKAAEKAKPAKAADDYYFDGEKYSGVMYEVEGRLEDGEVERVAVDAKAHLP
jgi:hypothetical protein